ncbi:hypothetical protein IWQ62_000264 [Dispira parvispora]|uniref:RxLR effector protein n=1 Tax=Dispira parvispora TaxID=1520584 RepID=A0A9W8E577_9FUNG|nr:hypothetical protein IWQ62_000264 [Dispira parvispora]
MKAIFTALFVLALTACVTAVPTVSQRQQLRPRVAKVMDNVVAADVKVLNKNHNRRGELLDVKADVNVHA